ncbi:FxLYD domain-containing protein, partial [Bacillus sp. JJ1503]|uniref:FxLYD domain-containing protein n=1 Tax=Bacillus sp. JJ1503 TaxID=3122956 RepID=UPI002FFF627D
LAFEEAEQQRIEKAMEAAAKEDLQNRTAAVSVSDFSAETDEYGDLYIIGNVKNVATTSISSITIYYTIYNENGGFLSSGYTSVYPYYLEPGELGYFDNIYYGVGQNVNVEIDNITWYLN